MEAISHRPYAGNGSIALSAGDGFFAIGRTTFISACNQGMNPAAVFLVLARGSGGDNVTTGWSAQAGAAYLGLRWSTAKTAIDRLVGSRLAKKVAKAPPSRPRYVLAQKGELIWLPNTLVDGVGEELPPLKKLRQTQDVMTLRLFIELYAEQNLREDGGISPKVIWQTYQRNRIGQRGEYVIWQFSDSTLWVAWNTTTRPHRIEPTADELNAAKEFFPRLHMLETLGLIEWVPCLTEGPIGEPIHPFAWNATLEVEQAVYEAGTAAARRCLTEGQLDIVDRDGGELVPVLAHIAEAQLVGIARLRYRPHTRLTAAWWANHLATCREYVARYEQVVPNQIAV